MELDGENEEKGEILEECPYCKTTANNQKCACGMLQILNGECLIEGGVAVSK
jgi:hypothetical protein